MLKDATGHADRMALLLLNLQNEVVDPRGAIGRSGLAAAARPAIEAASSWAEQARSSAIPVVHATFVARDQSCASTALNLRRASANAFVPGSWGAAPLPDLHRADDVVMGRDAMSAFSGTSLDALLRSWGRTHVLLAGVSTHLVVAATAFAATDLGLTTTVLSDACAAPDHQIHQAALNQLSAICDVHED